MKRVLFISLFLLQLMAELSAQTTDIKSQSGKYSDHGLGASFFLGGGFYSDQLSDNFSNPVYVGISIEYYRSGFVLQFDDYIGFGMTKESLNFSTQESWDEGGFVLSGMIHLGLGYAAIDNDNLMIVPTASIGFNKLSANIDELYDFKNDLKPILPHLKLGAFIDLKKIKIFKNHKSFNTDSSYSSPRLSFGYTLPISEPDYANFYGGNQFYFSIGFGGISKLN